MLKKPSAPFDVAIEARSGLMQLLMQLPQLLLCRIHLLLRVLLLY